MGVRTPASALSPEEFQEQREAAEEDELDHFIEEFDSAAEWNVYVAANEAEHAADESGSATHTLQAWENQGKAAALFLLVLLAVKGAESVAQRRF